MLTVNCIADAVKKLLQTVLLSSDLMNLSVISIFMSNPFIKREPRIKNRAQQKQIDKKFLNHLCRSVTKGLGEYKLSNIFQYSNTYQSKSGMDDEFSIQTFEHAENEMGMPLHSIQCDSKNTRHGHKLLPRHHDKRATQADSLESGNAIKNRHTFTHAVLPSLTHKHLLIHSYTSTRLIYSLICCVS